MKLDNFMKSVKTHAAILTMALGVSMASGLVAPQEAHAFDLGSVAQAVRVVGDVANLAGRTAEVGGRVMGSDNQGYNNGGYRGPSGNCVPGYATSDCPGGNQNRNVQQRVMVDPETGERVVVTVERSPQGQFNRDAVNNARNNKPISQTMGDAARTANDASGLIYNADSIARTIGAMRR